MYIKAIHHHSLSHKSQQSQEHKELYFYLLLKLFKSAVSSNSAEVDSNIQVSASSNLTSGSEPSSVDLVDKQIKSSHASSRRCRDVKKLVVTLCSTNMELLCCQHKHCNQNRFYLQLVLEVMCFGVVACLWLCRIPYVHCTAYCFCCHITFDSLLSLVPVVCLQVSTVINVSMTRFKQGQCIVCSVFSCIMSCQSVHRGWRQYFLFRLTLQDMTLES